jgi:iron complex transport system substrate-binding protein
VVALGLAACGTASGAEPSLPAASRAAPTGDVPVAVASPPTPQLPTTVRGADGRDVTVTDVSRVVALAGSIAETVVALGLGDRLVARDESTTVVETADLPVVSSGHAVSAEGVLAQRPTLVLTDARTGPPEALDALRAAGVAVVEVPEVWTLEEMAPRARAVGAALGVPAAADELVRGFDRLVVDPDPAGTRVAFLYLRGSAAVYLLGGQGSGGDSLIEAAGGRDAGSELGLDAFTPLTSESLVSAAPDVLLVMSKGLESVGGLDGLLALPGVAQTPAGRDRHVVAVEDGLLLSFGPRTGQVLEQLRAGFGAS